LIRREPLRSFCIYADPNLRRAHRLTVTNKTHCAFIIRHNKNPHGWLSFCV
jgi:hypothetical protein